MARVFSRWDRRQRQLHLHKRGLFSPIFVVFSSRRKLWRSLFIGLAILAVLPFVYFHLGLRRFQNMQSQKCSWIKNPPLVCAHGGDTTVAFPNTIDAYNDALSSQVDCIEIDVSRSSDGVLFALHDRDLQRLTGNATLRVGHLTSEEIAGAGRNHQRLLEFDNVNVPTVEDALRLVSRSVKQVILDAKVGPPLYEKGLAKDILSLVKKNRCKNCVIWAKSDSLVQDLIKVAPDTMVGYVVMIDPETRSRMKLLRILEAEVVGVYYPLVNEKLIKILHGSLKKVYVWTVDEEQWMAKLLSEQVDAMVTSHPTLLQRVMQHAKQQCHEQGFFKSW